MKRNYDIHGLLSVASDAVLPELEYFRTDHLSGPAAITLRIGRRPRAAHSAGPSMRVQEFLGRAGFVAELVSTDEGIEVYSNLLLKFSPHVLYTNIVEPILRWQFVQRGYALAHGACIASGGQALLITAQTDTGKTTTMLKALDAAPYGFLSDDLTILSEDGALRAYPKPLTISSHTVHAVRAARLTRRERATLPLQSRVHSRGGRRAAFLMTRTRLPVATINALAQLLVPPPKYPVTYLVPSATIVERAQLAGLAVIVRAQQDSTRELGTVEATDLLISNTDDAFGFPPYTQIEQFMMSLGNPDLRATERAIMTSALASVPATCFESASMGWATDISTWMYRLGAGVGQAEPGASLAALAATPAVAESRYHQTTLGT